MNYLKWTVATKNMKPMGYEFNKLFANNYKVYCKEIAGFKFWAWEKERILEINDWHHFTLPIINWYKANRDIIDPVHNNSLKIQYHYDSDDGQVQMFDYNEEFNVFTRYRDAKTDEEKNHAWDEWNSKYSGWSTAYLKKESMDKVLEEIEKIGGVTAEQTK